jgi:hypothetical protein
MFGWGRTFTVSWVDVLFVALGLGHIEGCVPEKRTFKRGELVLGDGENGSRRFWRHCWLFDARLLFIIEQHEIRDFHSHSIIPNFPRGDEGD